MGELRADAGSAGGRLAPGCGGSAGTGARRGPPERPGLPAGPAGPSVRPARGSRSVPARAAGLVPIWPPQPPASLSARPLARRCGFPRARGWRGAGREGPGALGCLCPRLAWPRIWEGLRAGSFRGLPPSSTFAPSFRARPGRAGRPQVRLGGQHLGAPTPAGALDPAAAAGGERRRDPRPSGGGSAGGPGGAGKGAEPSVRGGASDPGTFPPQGPGRGRLLHAS